MEHTSSLLYHVFTDEFTCRVSFTALSDSHLDSSSSPHPLPVERCPVLAVVSIIPMSLLLALCLSYV